MSFSIKTMNKISPLGLDLFGSSYEISDDSSAPDAIVVRSAKVDTDAFDGLLAVARAGAGTNNVTVNKASEKGICVFNTPGANANAVAELVFTGLGMAARNTFAGMRYTATLREMDDDAEITKLVEKNKSSYAGFELKGKKLTILGLGKIGVLVANDAAARGMEVVAYEPYPSVENVHMLDAKIEIYSELAPAIAGAELVSLHVPLLDATKGLINDGVLASLADGAIVCNFARGGVVDSNAMVKALDSGKVKSYVTDFPDAKVLAHENALCFPHLGASTGEAEENCATMAVDQLKDYLEFGIVRNSVNLPAVDGKPSMGVKSRLVVINSDVTGLIAKITTVLGEAGVSILSLKHESNGKMGYNLIDVQTEVGDDVVRTIESLDHVLKVRLLKF